MNFEDYEKAEKMFGKGRVVAFLLGAASCGVVSYIYWQHNTNQTTLEQTANAVRWEEKYNGAEGQRAELKAKLKKDRATLEEQAKTISTLNTKLTAALDQSEKGILVARCEHIRNRIVEREKEEFVLNQSLGSHSPISASDASDRNFSDEYLRLRFQRDAVVESIQILKTRLDNGCE